MHMWHLLLFYSLKFPKLQWIFNSRGSKDAQDNFLFVFWKFLIHLLVTVHKLLLISQEVYSGIAFTTIYCHLCRIYFTSFLQLFWKQTRRGSPVDRRPSTAEAPPMGQIYPFSKMSVTFEPVMQFWCPSGFRLCPGLLNIYIYEMQHWLFNNNRHHMWQRGPTHPARSLTTDHWKLPLSPHPTITIFSLDCRTTKLYHILCQGCWKIVRATFHYIVCFITLFIIL